MSGIKVVRGAELIAAMSVPHRQNIPNTVNRVNAMNLPVFFRANLVLGVMRLPSSC